MIIFFLILILVEVALLIGLVWAYKYLHLGHMVLHNLRVAVIIARTTLHRRLQQREKVVTVLDEAKKFLYDFLPGWLKFLLRAMKWVSKFHPQNG